jgi:CHAD domain-containing protein
MADIAKDAGLTGDETLLKGARKLLGHLWKVAGKNAPETLAGDADALHDMRVAVRRLRSALQNFEGEKDASPVAPHLRREFKEWRKQLGALGDALGAVRDYDVLNEYLDAYARTRLRAAIADDSGLAELRRHFLNERAAAFAIMVKRVNKATRPQAGREEFARYILGLPAASGPNPPLKEFAHSLIPPSRAEALSHAPSLENPLDEEGQHELRKSLKRLRYALEFFAPCFTEPPQQQIRQITQLQDTLGEMQDRSVLQQSIRRAFGEDEAHWPDDVTAFVRYGAMRRRRLLTVARKQWAELKGTFSDTDSSIA